MQVQEALSESRRERSSISSLKTHLMTLQEELSDAQHTLQLTEVASPAPPRPSLPIQVQLTDSIYAHQESE